MARNTGKLAEIKLHRLTFVVSPIAHCLPHPEASPTVTDDDLGNLRQELIPPIPSAELQLRLLPLLLTLPRGAHSMVVFIRSNESAASLSMLLDIFVQRLPMARPWGATGNIQWKRRG